MEKKVPHHMPQDASALKRDTFDQVLILGLPKLGKSTCVVVSACASFGPGYVINCGSKSGLEPAGRRTSKFKWDLVRSADQMDDAIKEARRGTKEGEYKWVVLDDFNLYASWLEQALEDDSKNAKGEPDGRRYWREYRKRIANSLVRLFDCKAHFYCIMHYMETSPEIEGQMEKVGRGIAPMLGGAARKEVPAMFKDVVLLDMDKKNERVFCVNPTGVYGPACRSLDGTFEIPADVGALHDAFVNGGPKRSNGSSASRERRSAQKDAADVKEKR